MSEPNADEIVVSVRAVGKVYRLYDHPQDRLKHMLLSHMGKSYGHEFWALRDVSFDVRRGEVVGIIGRNGSGKSTLLQTPGGHPQPAAGGAALGSGGLLELGSGFNLDCTGRENVVLNAAILGMSRREIARRVDEIVAFADIGEFIDQPVKMYSSGMFVRLAFAVTTSLDADVLLIDEALAVGDIFFRQKCYQRLAALREQGVAIVLVSHALNEVEQFCQRALLLHGGHVTFEGPALEAVKRYYLKAPEGAAAAGRRARASARRGDGSGVACAGSVLDLPGGPGDERRARCSSGAVRRRRKAPPGSARRRPASFTSSSCSWTSVRRGRRAGEYKGIIIHGRARSARIRCRATWTGPAAPGPQDIARAGERYTFNLGLGALTGATMAGARTSHRAGRELAALCLLPLAGTLAVALRSVGTPVQLLHHGVANLPGSCQMSVARLPVPLAAEPGAAAGAHGAPVSGRR
jgi:lipopolysaccharide transport system ATP-binding protein